MCHCFEAITLRPVISLSQYQPQFSIYVLCDRAKMHNTWTFICILYTYVLKRFVPTCLCATICCARFSEMFPYCSDVACLHEFAFSANFLPCVRHFGHNIRRYDFNVHTLYGHAHVYVYSTSQKFEFIRFKTFPFTFQIMMISRYD